jgi:hypothetical protein
MIFVCAPRSRQIDYAGFLKDQPGCPKAIKGKGMKTGFLLPILLASLAGQSAWGNAAGQAAGQAAANPGAASYVLRAGQSILVAPGTKLTLDRINDSRCRTGAVCVWAGYISYSFILKGKSGASRFVLSDSMPGAARSATRQKITFTLVSVAPQAPPAVDAATPDYRVTLQVNPLAPRPH